MNYARWISIFIAGILIAACFFPWVIIEEKIIVSGFQSDIESYGKPGFVHLFLSVLYILLLLIGRSWSTISAFFIIAFNIAWAIRNFLKISACSGGECPEKQPALYIILFCSIALPVLTALIKVKRIHKP